MSEIPQALQERMVALVQLMASTGYYGASVDADEAAYDEARAIVALLPDHDEALARSIAAQVYGVDTAKFIDASSAGYQAAFAAIKAMRAELAGAAK